MQNPAVQNPLDAEVRRWPTWALIFGFWFLIAVLYGSQNLLSSYSQNRPIEWGRLISWSVTRWFLWAALTPLVFKLAARFPISRNELPKTLSIHLGLGLAVGFFHLVLETATNYVVWRLAGEPILPLERFAALMTYSLHVNLLVYWALIGASYALDYYRKFQERELKASQLEAKLSQAQLGALKSQIHPHFLFNTHHAILSLMMKKENDKAIKMLTRLSDLLRLTLDNTNVNEVSLKQELEFLELYLEIQRTRFQDRLKVTLDIEPETLHAQIPNLVLQPLVENAIQHGIAPHSFAGNLEIQSKKDNGRLILLIKDDGPGLPTGENGFHEGIGLANTKARLKQMYGDAFKLDLNNGHHKGLVVRLELPFAAADPEAGS